MISTPRQMILTKLEDAKWKHDAAELIKIMKTEERFHLTDDDINDIYVNVLCRAANDEFSKNLKILNVHEVFHKAFPNYK